MRRAPATRRSSRTTALLAILATAVGITAAAADQPRRPLSCIDIKNTRFQLCGSVKPFTQFTVGGGVRFSLFGVYEVDPAGRLTAVSAAHAECASAASDPAVPLVLRSQARALCIEHFASDPPPASPTVRPTLQAQ